MRLAQLSDLHIHSPHFMKSSVFFTHGLPNRRLLGAANFLLGRASVHSIDVLRSAVNAVSQAEADFCVITGDLSNLAIDAEFEFVRSIIDGIGGPDRLSIIPGNHDYYTPESIRVGRFERHFHDLIFNGGPAVYPVVRDFDGCRLILARTPTKTPAGFSWGRLGEEQLAEIKRLAVEGAGQGRFVVLAQHHNLHDRGDVHETIGPLKDRAAELAMIADAPIGAVIHGHDHKHRDWEIASGHPSGRARVICCGSSTYDDEARGRLGRMTVLDIRDGSLLVEKWMYQPEKGRFVRSPEN